MADQQPDLCLVPRRFEDPEQQPARVAPAATAAEQLADIQRTLDWIEGWFEEQTDGIKKQVDGIKERIDRIEGRFDRIDGQVYRMEGQVYRMEGRMDQMEGRMDGRMDRMEARQIACDSNALARVMNSKVLFPEDRLHALRAPATNEEIPDFPKRRRDIDEMDEHTLDMILRALDQPSGGGLSEKRKQLKFAVGIILEALSVPVPSHT